MPAAGPQLELQTRVQALQHRKVLTESSSLILSSDHPLWRLDQSLQLQGMHANDQAMESKCRTTETNCKACGQGHFGILVAKKVGATIPRQSAQFSFVVHFDGAAISIKT